MVKCSLGIVSYEQAALDHSSAADFMSIVMEDQIDGLQISY